MKTIEVDDDIYAYIASHTRDIGESASSILRRLLQLDINDPENDKAQKNHEFADLIRSGKLLYGSATDKFLKVLAEAHNQKPDKFQVVLECQGRDRVYFARSKQEILDSGSSTHPKQIPGTEYWVMTNSQTIKKRYMLRDVLKGMNFSPEACAEITQLIR